MAKYGEYVRRLETLVLTGTNRDLIWTARCAKALDGEPDRELQKSLSLSTRRRLGAFFTGAVLAQKAIGPNVAQDSPIVFDPACGLGDLLLAASEYLPTCTTLSATLGLWGRHLTGCDIRADFVQT